MRRRLGPSLSQLSVAAAWFLVFVAGCAPSSTMPDRPFEPSRPAAEEEDTGGLFGRVDTSSPFLEVVMVDVGQGDGMVLHGPEGEVIVLDTGKGGGPIVSYLKSRGVRSVDLMVLTHAHADHIGGADDVVKGFEVKRVVDPLEDHDSTMYAKLMGEVEQRGIPVLEARQGRRIKMGGGVELEMLAPPQPHLSGTRSDPNANSVVLRLTYGSISILFTGDAEHETEEVLLKGAAERPLESTVLKVAHHGSRYASSEEFLAQVKPQLALISVGEGNTYKHPAPETLERLSKHTAHVYRTDLHGTIRLLTDGRRITLIPERGDALP